MDESISEILQQIADELKKRNELAMESSNRLKDIRKKPDDMLEKLKADSEERQKKLENQTEEIQQRTEASRESSRKFQSDLLFELRRLNNNFEAFLNRSSGLL